MQQEGGAIGRMVYAHPSSGKWFNLHTLLTAVKRATSYDDLHTVNGTTYITFLEACIAHGLLADYTCHVVTSGHCVTHHIFPLHHHHLTHHPPSSSPLRAPNGPSGGHGSARRQWPTVHWLPHHHCPSIAMSLPHPCLGQ